MPHVVMDGGDGLYVFADKDKGLADNQYLALIAAKCDAEKISVSDEALREMFPKLKAAGAKIYDYRGMMEKAR